MSKSDQFSTPPAQVQHLRSQLHDVYSQTRRQRDDVEKLLVSLVIWEATVLKPLETQLPSRERP